MDGLTLLKNHFQDVFQMSLTDQQAEKILHVAAECIVMIDQQDYEDQTRAAYDDGGGCSRCGDLSGYECICDEDDEFNACSQCDGHPACEDFGCAIIHGIPVNKNSDLV